jgi:hypothetical protein
LELLLVISDGRPDVAADRAIDIGTRRDNFAEKFPSHINKIVDLAALIVGAALLMQVSTRFTIFGYPGLAILCFLAAAGGGTALAIEIAFYDQRPRKFGSDAKPRN